jgi:MFS family permease
VAWYEVLSKTVHSYKRPVLFAWRQTGAGIIALLAGGIITWALSPKSGMAFPLNYLFLLILMTALIAIGILCFNFVVEPVDTAVIKRRRPLGEYFRLGPQIMREDHNYRRLFWGQITFALAVMSTPFLVPFLIKDLQVDDSVIGMLMIVAASADLLINVYWGQLGTREGNRAVLVLGSKLAAYSPLLALGAVLMPKMAVLGIDMRIILVALSLVMSRIAGSGLGVGRMNYLLDVAPLGMRPSYMGFMNTFSAVSMVIPMTAGSIIQMIGYVPVFALAVVFGIVCIRVTMQLEDVKFTSSPNSFPAGGG